MYKKILCCLLAVALALTAGGIRFILPAQAEQMIDEEVKIFDTATLEDDFADNRVLVILSNEASLEFRNYTSLDFPEISCSAIQDLSTASGAKVQAKLRGEEIATASVEVAFMNQNIKVEEFRRTLCLELENPGKGNVLKAVRALEQREDVYYAGPDYAIQLNTPVYTNYATTYNWGAIKIETPEAWDIEAGSSSVKVGVVDTGIDAQHPDLSGRVSTSLSRNFASDSISPVTDPLGHGTHVAGIIGGRGINEWGIEGVCEDVTLVSLRVLDATGKGYCSYVANAINYAEEQNISILNLSIDIDDDGTRGQLQSAAYYYTGILICSAGNGDNDIDIVGASVPAGYDYENMVIVGASTQSDAKASFSNYGNETVDLFAPGDLIASCYSTSVCTTTGCSITGHIDYGYHYTSGTSMAAPYVTGVVALIRSIHPSISRNFIKMIITNSVDKVNTLDDLSVAGGRLNAYKALTSPILHNESYFDAYSDTQHWRYCQVCNYSTLEDHVNDASGQCTRCFYPNNV